MEQRNEARKRDLDQVSPPDAPVGSLMGLAGYHMRIAHALVFQDFRNRLGATGITPAHLGILLVVSENKHISQTSLSKAMRMDRSSLVGVIDKLEAKGWLKRGKPTTDRRRNELYITSAGTKMLQEIWPNVQAHEEAITERLTVRERETFLRLLAKVAGTNV